MENIPEKDLGEILRIAQDFGSGLSPSTTLRVTLANRLNLGCQSAMKMGLGQLRWPSCLTGTPPTAPIR